MSEQTIVGKKVLALDASASHVWCGEKVVTMGGWFLSSYMDNAHDGLFFLGLLVDRFGMR